MLLHACTIEDRVLIGMGSVLLDGAIIGEESVVGAGSLVTPGTHIPPRSIAWGRPAKVVRPITDKEVEDWIMFGVREYLEYKEEYRELNIGGLHPAFLRIR